MLPSNVLVFAQAAPVAKSALSQPFIPKSTPVFKVQLVPIPPLSGRLADFLQLPPLFLRAALASLTSERD